MLPFLIPVLTSLASNGLGILAGAIQAKGKNLIEEKLGVKIPNSAEEFTPELLHELKVKEIEHEEFLLSIQIKEKELFLADTKDARHREIEIVTASGAPLLNKIITPILAIGVLLLTFGLFATVMFGTTPVDTTRKDLLVYILGVLSAVATQVIAYYFGSSSGSKEKSEQLHGMEKRK